MMDCIDLIRNCIIVCQSAKKWAGICCMTLNSIVLGPAACANLLPCRILLFLGVELQVYSSLPGQVVCIAQSEQ